MSAELYWSPRTADPAAVDPSLTLERAAAAYNGGPGRLARHLRGEVPLSAQTERYVGWTGGMWRERREPRSATYAAWWDAGGERLVRRAARALGVEVDEPAR